LVKLGFARMQLLKLQHQFVNVHDYVLLGAVLGHDLYCIEQR
jgi:hypothetical protein